MDVRRLDELVACLSGELAGRMGLRSHLGAMLEGTSGGRGADGPSDRALDAVHTADQVLGGLDRLAAAHVEVLVAAYCPRGPASPFGAGPRGPDGLLTTFESAAIASVAALLEGREIAESPDAGAARLRARIQGRVGAPPEARRALSRNLASAKARARRALELAEDAYLAAFETALEDAREQRRAARRR